MDEVVISNNPIINIFFLPYISANFPDNDKKTAVPTKKLERIHCDIEMLICNSFVIMGNAIFIIVESRPIRRIVHCTTKSTNHLYKGLLEIIFIDEIWFAHFLFR